MVHICKNGSHLDRWASLRKMGHIWEGERRLENGSNIGKISRTYKNGSHMETWVNLENGLHLKK